MNKSKYYYQYNRNLDNSKQMNDWKEDVIADDNGKWGGGKIPNYYIGSVYKYEARKVIEDWSLSYNTGTAVSYLLRAGKKVEEGMDNNDKHIEDIEKAINHLRFEIDKLQK
tara:strand:+ start:930 stop:1262 length:333 start_codon:yes stop_codon:yes gene_type:complete